MNRGPSVIVIGSPSRFFPSENGYSVTTEGIKRYLEEIDNSFGTVEYYSEEGSSDGSSHCSLGINDENLHTQSTESLLCFLLDIIKNNINIITHDESEVVSLVYLPSMFSFLLTPAILYKSDKIVLYYMSDTENVIWEGNRYIDKIKDTIYRLLDRVLLSNADAVLYRDETVMDRTPQGDQILLRSKPIMALDIEEPFVREDTCESEPIKILYVGSLIHRKGVDYLLHSFEELQNNSNGIEYSLKIVGDGDKREELIELCKDLEITQKVKFVGHIPKEKPLLREYRAADVFVLPSLEEGFPRVITEAMSQSLPVITTRVGEIDDRLGEKEAIKIGPESADEITQAINTIVSDRILRKELIKNGRKFVDEIMTNSAADQHVSLIYSLTHTES